MLDTSLPHPVSYLHVGTPRVNVGTNFRRSDEQRLKEIADAMNAQRQRWPGFDAVRQGSVEGFLQGALEAQKRPQDGELRMAVRLKSGTNKGLLIGGISARVVGGTALISAFIDPAYQDRGFRREAIIAGNILLFSIDCNRLTAPASLRDYKAWRDLRHSGLRMGWGRKREFRAGLTTFTKRLSRELPELMRIWDAEGVMPDLRSAFGLDWRPPELRNAIKEVLGSLLREREAVAPGDAAVKQKQLQRALKAQDNPALAAAIASSQPPLHELIEPDVAIRTSLGGVFKLRIGIRGKAPVPALV